VCQDGCCLAGHCHKHHFRHRCAGCAECCGVSGDCGVPCGPAACSDGAICYPAPTAAPVQASPAPPGH
jgi:hypothetical protein